MFGSEPEFGSEPNTLFMDSKAGCDDALVLMVNGMRCESAPVESAFPYEGHSTASGDV